MATPTRAELGAQAEQLLNRYGLPVYRSWQSPLAHMHTETPFVGMGLIARGSRRPGRVDFQVRTDGNYTALVQLKEVLGEERSEETVYTFRGTRRRDRMNPRKLKEISPEAAATHLRRIQAALEDQPVQDRYYR